MYKNIIGPRSSLDPFFIMFSFIRS